MPPSALSTPLLVVTLVSLAIYAARFAAVRRFRQLADWWIALALVLVVTAAAAIVPSTRPLTGVFAFGALSALVLLPQWFERQGQRAARLANKPVATLFAVLSAILHPSARNRAQPRVLRTVLALREGREVPAHEIESIAEGQPEVARALALIVEHNRGNARAVFDAMASAEDRPLFYAMGMGLLHLRAVALLDPTPESLVRTITEVTALDPTINDPDRKSLLVAFSLAYLGDREHAFEASRALAAYLAPGEPHALRALALFCAGDLERAQHEIREGISSNAKHPAAVHSLETLSRVLREAPPRTASLHSESLADLVKRLRAEARALAVIAPLEGRSNTPWLTVGWSVALVLVYGWLSWRGSPYDPEHLVRSGGLLTADFTVLGDVRSAWPKLFTHGLLHAGALHLLFNLLAFNSFGQFCEAFYGRIRTVVIYLLAAAASGLAVARFADPLRPTVLVGASGSIFALGGAVLAAVVVDKELRATPRGRRELVVLVLLFTVQTVMDQLVPGVSGTAHLAGLATGAIVGAIFTLISRWSRPSVSP
ncbi:MAG: rhomboid family intramembrane serine protease [Myxococcales bacterium]|nr:rhomboid family intramembrane serine protease [Myxococcales bacterium]